MASKKKVAEPVEEEVVTVEENPAEVVEKVEEVEEIVEKAAGVEKEERIEKKQKHAIGSIVYVSKDADADLNGFKLFPQYKKYTYTVEAYDASSDVYTLRRLNLSLRLKSDLILAPHEKADSPVARKQF